MIRSRRVLTVAILGCVLCLPAIVAVQSEDGRNGPGKDWPLTGGDWTSQRYSTLSQINVSTVNNLGAAWISKKFDDNAVSVATPIVKDGLMFLTAGSRVYAYNAKTGEMVWSYQSETRATPNGQGISVILETGHAVPSLRGVAVGEGLVFVGLTDGRMLGLRQKTGQLVWSQQTGENPPISGQSSSAAPTYAQGLVFSGLGAGDFALRGRVVALDAKNGNKVWQFFTIPGPGEFGHDSWPKDNDAWKHGGAGVWMIGALDVDLGLVYFATGNAFPDYGGEVRPGDNLFNSSVIALEMKTGRLRWHYQLVHHEVWDADQRTPPVLVDVPVAGRTRKALAAMRGDGYLFLLDRETGKPLFPVEERPVEQNAKMKTSATQPFPVGAEQMLPSCDEWAKEKIPAGFKLGCYYGGYFHDTPNLLQPGLGLGFVPMAYSPQTGYFYATGTASLGWRKRGDDPYYLPLGGARVPGLPSHGIVAAIDSRTNKIAWSKRVPVPIGRSGILVTAGGLMFRGTGDGNIEASDAKSGNVLWQFQTAVAGGSGPLATYEVDGDQYLAAIAGNAVWAFKLGGQVLPQPVPTPAASVAGFAGPIEDTARIETMTLSGTPVLAGGHRYFLDEYAFNPYRGRVKVGTPVKFGNNGRIAHTIASIDGSWTTGRLNPASEVILTFDKPGTHTYICKEHPWSYGQLIVVP